MSDPERDKLYLNVGRCLTAWNSIEAEVLTLIAYATNPSPLSDGGVIAASYWAVVSFEARLKWCNAAVTYRLVGSDYEVLANRWNALNNKMIDKARKRAEVAHGSVRNFVGKGYKRSLFIPYYNRRRHEHVTMPKRQGGDWKPFSEEASHLTVADLEARVESFHKLSDDLSDFHTQWRDLDFEIATRAPKPSRRRPPHSGDTPKK